VIEQGELLYSGPVTDIVRRAKTGTVLHVGVPLDQQDPPRHCSARTPTSKTSQKQRVPLRVASARASRIFSFVPQRLIAAGYKLTAAGARNKSIWKTAFIAAHKRDGSVRTVICDLHCDLQLKGKIANCKSQIAKPPCSNRRLCLAPDTGQSDPGPRRRDQEQAAVRPFRCAAGTWGFWWRSWCSRSPAGQRRRGQPRGPGQEQRAALRHASYYSQLALVCFLAPILHRGCDHAGEGQPDVRHPAFDAADQRADRIGSMLSRLFFIVVVLVSRHPVFSKRKYSAGGDQAIVRSFGIRRRDGGSYRALAMAIAVFKCGTRRTIFSFYMF